MVDFVFWQKHFVGVLEKFWFVVAQLEYFWCGEAGYCGVGDYVD